MSTSSEKIAYYPQQLDKLLESLKRPWVFTNGCFDILHRGHIAYLEQAEQLGRSLIVAINDDTSVRRQDKGRERPINTLEDRAAVIAALQCVDAVVPFDQDTPLLLIKKIRPDHLVKGGDWPIENIVGAKEVISHGGQVHSIPFRYQRSTTALIERIRGPT